jgi:hypothetical protein
VSGELHALAASSTRERTRRYPLDRRLAEPQSRSGGHYLDSNSGPTAVHPTILASAQVPSRVSLYIKYMLISFINQQTFRRNI